VLVHGLVSGRYLVPVAERLAGRGVTAVPVAGAAHTVNWAAPDRLADLVTGFAAH